MRVKSKVTQPNADGDLCSRFIFIYFSALIVDWTHYTAHGLNIYRYPHTKNQLIYLFGDN